MRRIRTTSFWLLALPLENATRQQHTYKFLFTDVLSPVYVNTILETANALLATPDIALRQWERAAHTKLFALENLLDERFKDNPGAGQIVVFKEYEQEIEELQRSRHPDMPKTDFDEDFLFCAKYLIVASMLQMLYQAEELKAEDIKEVLCQTAQRDH